jgi:hypothetical protein
MAARAPTDPIGASLEQVARLGVLQLGPEDEKLGQPTGVRNAAIVSRRARELATELEENAAKIRATRHYTDAGVRAVLGDAALRTLAELERIRPALQQAVDDRDRRRKELATTAVANGDDVAAALLRQELRRELKAVGDALLVKAKVLKAIEKGDRATLTAVLETGGTVFALLPEAELAEVRQAWARKMSPDRARELARIEAAVAEAQRVMADAEARVRKIGGLPADGPLKHMARGEALPPDAAA